MIEGAAGATGSPVADTVCGLNLVFITVREGTGFGPATATRTVNMICLLEGNDRYPRHPQGK